MIECKYLSLCVSVMWIRCPVSSRRCTGYFFIGAENGRRGSMSRSATRRSIFYIFQYLSCWKGQEQRIEHAHLAVEGRFRLEKRLWMSRAAFFFCNFHHQLTRVLYLRCFKTIIWLSFIPVFSYRRKLDLCTLLVRLLSIFTMKNCNFNIVTCRLVMFVPLQIHPVSFCMLSSNEWAFIHLVSMTNNNLCACQTQTSKLPQRDKRLPTSFSSLFFPPTVKRSNLISYVNEN